MTETLPVLPAAGAVQHGLDPLGDFLTRPLRCGLVAGLPVLADADMQVRGLPVIDGGPASGALGLIHAPIIGSNKCVDKYSFEVFNVNTLNQEATMKNEKFCGRVVAKNESPIGNIYKVDGGYIVRYVIPGASKIGNVMFEGRVFSGKDFVKHHFMDLGYGIDRMYKFATEAVAA